jgi:hypothetical protein
MRQAKSARIKTATYLIFGFMLVNHRAAVFPRILDESHDVRKLRRR